MQGEEVFKYDKIRSIEATRSDNYGETLKRNENHGSFTLHESYTQ